MHDPERINHLKQFLPHTSSPYTNRHQITRDHLYIHQMIGAHETI